MLTFEEKLAIIASYPALERKNVSLGRVNFKFKESVFEKENLVYHLHPNGNGYVFAELIDADYPLDKNGMVNIRDFSEQALRKVIDQAIESLSEQEPYEESWINHKNQTLLLINDFDSWNVYTGEMLEATFATYNGAVSYLEEEGFEQR